MSTDGWDRRNDALWSRRMGPLLLEVEQWARNSPRWSWRFCVGGTSDRSSNYANAIERSGPMMSDLMTEAEAKAACLDAALAFGQSIVDAGSKP